MRCTSTHTRTAWIRLLLHKFVCVCAQAQRTTNTIHHDDDVDDDGLHGLDEWALLVNTLRLSVHGR